MAERYDDGATNMQRVTDGKRRSALTPNALLTSETLTQRCTTCGRTVACGLR